MTDQSPSRLPIVAIAISGIVLLLGCALLIAAIVIILDPFSMLDGGGIAAVDATPTLQATRIIPTATTRPTDTPSPTATVAPPTETPTVAETPTPEPTATTAATSRPAATTPPRPTNTNVPPTSPPASARIANPTFSLESSTVGANQAIWFNFYVKNGTQAELFYGMLGAGIIKDGNRVHFQASYSNASLTQGQEFSWRDHTEIGTPGVYQLQLAICYTTPKEGCNWTTGAGEWELLGAPVTVTIQ